MYNQVIESIKMASGNLLDGIANSMFKFVDQPMTGQVPFLNHKTIYFLVESLKKYTLIDLKIRVTGELCTCQ